MGIVDGHDECASCLDGGCCLGLFYLVNVHLSVVEEGDGSCVQSRTVPLPNWDVPPQLAPRHHVLCTLSYCKFDAGTLLPFMP